MRDFKFASKSKRKLAFNLLFLVGMALWSVSFFDVSIPLVSEFARGRFGFVILGIIGLFLTILVLFELREVLEQRRHRDN